MSAYGPCDDLDGDEAATERRAGRQRLERQTTVAQSAEKFKMLAV